jgi:hypothetical protein
MHSKILMTVSEAVAAACIWHLSLVFLKNQPLETGSAVFHEVQSQDKIMDASGCVHNLITCEKRFRVAIIIPDKCSP